MMKQQSISKMGAASYLLLLFIATMICFLSVFILHSRMLLFMHMDRFLPQILAAACFF